MTDSELREFALKIDAELWKLCEYVNNQPLVLSGILLARLTHLNDMLLTGADFRKLATFISNQPIVQYHTEQPAEDFSQANKILDKFRKPGS